MPRGITPRRPSRGGSHEGQRPVQKAPARVSPPSQKPVPVAAKPLKKITGYNPLAPDRISQILIRLDQLYPNVTCALTHRSAWELVVATILSAQSTDVRVNMVT